MRLIPVEDVVYFQSDEKYTRVALEDSEVLIRKPIKELLEELDPTQFWQIHRSTLVNTRAIAGVACAPRPISSAKAGERRSPSAGILRICSSRCRGSPGRCPESIHKTLALARFADNKAVESRAGG